MDSLQKSTSLALDICTILLVTICFHSCSASYHEEQLYENLFTRSKYSTLIRPVINDNDTVFVTFGLSLYQILEVHEKSEMLVTSTWIRQRWNNPYMKWKKEDFNGIETINVDPGLIWKPDIVLYNSVDEDKFLGANLNRLNTLVTLHHDGNATWLAPILLKSKCDIDVTYFPYDTQICPLKFGSWTYDKQRLDLRLEGPRALTGKYAKNSAFQLNSAMAERHEEKYECCEELYPDVTYLINISRRTLFYQSNLVFPMVVIGMLTMCSFLLPAQSGERMGLALTLLLSMTVFMLLIADMIPTTSDVIPLVGLFFKATMVEMIVMIIALCFIMKLYHRSSDDPPMPKWVRSYIYECLAYIVCVRRRNESKNIESGQKMSVSFQPTAETDWLLKKEQENKEEMKSIIGPETGIIVKKLDVVTEKLKDMDKQDLVLSEWVIVAKTIDRCLLLLFLISYLIILAAFLLSSPGYVP